MVERVLGRLNINRVRNPVNTPLPENHPVPHTTKKPVLAVTGTKPDRICTICLGRLEPGTALTFCDCGKFFHLACIYEIDVCPLCGFELVTIEEEEPSTPIENPEKGEVKDEEYGTDMVEIMYQCPLCESYVDEDTEQCKCGAIFDNREEEVYLCPQCGNEVEPDSNSCLQCGAKFK
jgi:hypothetical protein